MRTMHKPTKTEVKRRSGPLDVVDRYNGSENKMGVRYSAFTVHELEDYQVREPIINADIRR